MKVVINNKEYNVKIDDNDTTRMLISKLPIDIKMQELNGNEFYYYLDFKLPTNKYNPSIINKGDIMLYNDNCLVIFYKTFKTNYEYTKIGHIDDLANIDEKNIQVAIFN